MRAKGWNRAQYFVLRSDSDNLSCLHVPSRPFSLSLFDLLQLYVLLTRFLFFDELFFLSFIGALLKFSRNAWISSHALNRFFIRYKITSCWCRRRCTINTAPSNVNRKEWTERKEKQSPKRPRTMETTATLSNRFFFLTFVFCCCCNFYCANLERTRCAQRWWRWRQWRRRWWWWWDIDRRTWWESENTFLFCFYCNIHGNRYSTNGRYLPICMHKWLLRVISRSQRFLSFLFFPVRSDESSAAKREIWIFLNFVAHRLQMVADVWVSDIVAAGYMHLIEVVATTIWQNLSCFRGSLLLLLLLL